MRHRPRRRPHPAPRRTFRGSDDRGATLVIVIAVAVVGLLLATTVAAVAVRSETSAATDRGRTQAIAAAEAGLDSALVSLRSMDSADSTTFVCGPTTTDVWSAPGSSRVTVTYDYFSLSGLSLCPPATGTVLTRAELVSTAVYTQGSTTASRAVRATVDLARKAADPSEVFDVGMFSDGQFASSAPVRIYGNVYSNANYACSSDSLITGSLRVQGSFNGSSTCTVEGDMTLGGTFAFSSAVRVGGRLTSASASASSVSSISARVMGAARLRSTVSGASPAVFPGGLTQNASPAPAAPEPRQMPVVRYTPSDWTSSTIQTAAQWASANRASGSACAPNARTLRAPAGSTVVNAVSCAPYNLNNLTLELSGDLTIFASGLSSSQPVKVISGDGQAHTLRIIEPASGTNVCSAGGRGISVNSTFDVDSRIRTFLYTPGGSSFSSVVTVNGAIYACRASFSGNVTINYDTTPLPPVAGEYGTGYKPSTATKSDVS